MTEPREDRCYVVLKRAMDIVGALLGLFFLSFLFLPIAIAIKLNSQGPIFFVQTRVGRGGRLFSMYKFRTMYLDSPALGKVPLDEDTRVTTVGRFLRRMGLDEMPQFINVLKGEMSLVGPRPELPELFAAYAPWQRRRIEVLPGVTGWWQVNGRKQPMIDYIHYDIYYVENRSLALDLKILLMTIPALMRSEA
ncbi:MAG: sugar transferase [Chloroflexi bacterium]|nr:sugar transferase [Chloroflexota bacterium]